MANTTETDLYEHHKRVKRKASKLLDRLVARRILEHNAYQSYAIRPGTETGCKALERYDKHSAEFDRLAQELAEVLR